MSAGEPGSITSTRGAQVTGILAVIYGVGVAFWPERLGAFQQVWLFGGAVILLVLFVVFLVTPLLRSLGSRGRAS